jgi:hypothetical protein
MKLSTGGINPEVATAESQGRPTTGMSHSWALSNFWPLPEGQRRCVDRRVKTGARVMPRKIASDAALFFRERKVSYQEHGRVASDHTFPTG